MELLGGGKAHGRPLHRPPPLITVDVDVPSPGVNMMLSWMLASSLLSDGVCTSSLVEVVVLLMLEREAGGSERNSEISLFQPGKLTHSHGGYDRSEGFDFLHHSER